MRRKHLLHTFAATTALFALVTIGSAPGNSGSRQSQFPNLKSPAGSLPGTRHITIAGFDGAVIPNGRFVTPAGVEVPVGAPKPFGMALSPDGKTVATVNSGVGPFSITLVRNLTTSPTETLIKVNATFMGVVFPQS